MATNQNDLAKGDGQERVVDPAPVRDEARDHGAGYGGSQGCGREAEPEVRPELELEQAEAVGADAEERAMAERWQRRVARAGG